MCLCLNWLFKVMMVLIMGLVIGNVAQKIGVPYNNSISINNDFTWNYKLAD